MPDVELAYLAGVFDGEGCVLASTSKVSSGLYYPRLLVSMTDQAPLKLFQSRFGGKIYIRASHAKLNPKHKIQYEWIVRADAAANVARQLAELCIVKKPQLMLLQMLARSGKKGLKVSDEARARSLWVFNELRRLKGIPVHD